MTPALARRTWRLLTAGCAVALLTLLHGCASLPPPPARTPVSALADTDDTPLAQVWRHAPSDRARDVTAAIHPLPDAQDAFAARVLLARAAQRSLDVQYYIWRDDVTGRLLWRELRLAAERGVRVRLLIDDNSTKGLDAMLAALDGVPNLEVRLVNPFANRGFRLADFATDFSRVNRRMHNKSMTADNQAAIVGGRNIGDEYFGAGGHVEFSDLDVIAFGPVVREVSASFDRYWNSPSAYPARALLKPLAPDAAMAELERLDRTLDDAAAKAYLRAVARTPLVAHLIEGRLPLEWVPARLVADDPAKLTQPPEGVPPNLAAQLQRALGEPRRRFDLISPYFVPGKQGTADLVALEKSGVHVRVLTNSLSATDVAAVHAGYAKRRKDLVAGGIELYELKPDAAPARPQVDSQGVGGSSDASLHAKTFAVDGEKIFVGSFNFDPRSYALNTELGVLFASRSLAAAMASAFDGKIPANAYELRLAEDGELEWVERSPQGEQRYRHDPGAGLVKRLSVGVLSLLPIEWLL